MSSSNSDYAEDDTSKEVVTVDAKKIIEKEFPQYFSEGKFITRISYVDYIDQALEKFKELGLEKNLEAYKELLRVFPPGKYCPTNKWEFGVVFSTPQQLAATRVLFQMERNGVRPDKEVERIVVGAFSKKSDVWIKIARMNFWSMKGRNVDLYPIPEQLPKETHELAKIAVMRMLDDKKSIISVSNTSSLQDSVDNTWIVHAQSPAQKAIIARLDEDSTLFLEDCGLAYVGDRFLSYYALKSYDSAEELERRKQRRQKPEYNYNTLNMKFYGKPIREKMQEQEEAHYVDNGYILGICITGTSSQDSLLSWLKILQTRNPKLKKLNVVFRMSRQTPELIEYKQQSNQQN